jgi:hypothetical protein
MSTFLTVVVEKQPAGQPLAILPRVLDSLDALATRLGCALLSTFVREDPELFAELADHLDEETRARLAHRVAGQTEWHEPSAGLATVERLLEYVRKAEARELHSQFREAESDLVVKAVLQSDGKSLAEAVCEELENGAEELRRAAGNGSKFHFDIG